MKFAHLTTDVKAWARRLIDDLNRISDPVSELQEFADDTAAGAGGIAIGSGYRATDGSVRWRRA
jgi:hypothetical protein